MTFQKARGELWSAMHWLEKAEQALAAGEAKKASEAAETAQNCIEYMRAALRLEDR